MRKLGVFVNGMRVGVITERAPGRGYVFSYDAEFVADSYPPISLTLPISIEPYESDCLMPFFTNLLPEGTLRKIICRERHIDEDDFFGMLMATADTDTIGAVSFRIADNV